jgi:2-C-methyl-D-erythritol 4-phosphate cytidylyltransferase / 2-C-methyl-D-erythritol 2,4-cyclodiphosphate synthase
MPGSGVADAIVVAAGSSQRMDGLDKLAWEVAGRPLLAYTLSAVAAAPSVASVVVVTAPDRVAAVQAAPWLPSRVVAVVEGGSSRHDSVRAGFTALEAARPDPLGQRPVLVHDGGRPCVSTDLVEAVVAAVERHGAAIPAVPVAETIKRVEGQLIVATVDRADLVTAQTPQGVRRGLLRRALTSDAAASATWTDEAALLEACTIPVHVLPGDPTNLKVTVPADLTRVASVLVPGGGSAERRTGIGQDGHPFGPGQPLMLGGVAFESAPRLTGHSDGDVLLHALADALLGAAGMGDLGRLFPADASTPRGIAGRDIIAAVGERLSAAGWRPIQVDATVIAARPRLGVRLDALRDSIADQLELPSDAVNIKASTGNLDGTEGAGRGISALVVATVERLP